MPDFLRASLLCFSLSLPPSLFASDHGTLIFEDTFDRTESQELKDEPGNEWTTSSDKTAEGNKEVDLRDGYMYIYTHPVAWHATSVRHAFEFRDGTLALRFMLADQDDSLTLNFADMELPSVHAGHLFMVTISEDKVVLADQKTGQMDLVIRNARQDKTITPAQEAMVATKSKTFPHDLAIGVWHEVRVTLRDATLSCDIDGHPVGSFTSAGFAHPTKRLLRLLVAKNAFIDDVRIWRKN
jgi:hypothetical protein